MVVFSEAAVLIRRPYELTDEQYARIEDLLPTDGRRGGQWNRLAAQ
jgi:hypothetical protein